MRVVFSGSRGYSDERYYALFVDAVRLSGYVVTEVIHGDEHTSVDHLAHLWAIQKGILETPVPAEWTLRGLPVGSAGPIRNRKMAKMGEVLVALWDGRSRGTRDMIGAMKAERKSGFIYRLDGAPHERFPRQLSLLG